MLSAREDAYLPGTPVDDKLLDAGACPVRVIRIRCASRPHKDRAIDQSLSTCPPVRRCSRATAPAVVGARPIRSAAVRVSYVRSRRSPRNSARCPTRMSAGSLPPWPGLRAFSSNPPDVVFSSAPPWTTHLVAISLGACVAVPMGRRLPRSVGAIAVDEVSRRSAAARLRDGSKARGARQRCRHRSRPRARAESSPNTTVPSLADRFHVVFNGCDPDEFADAQPDRDESHFTLLHAGTLYGGRSPVPLIRALGRLCAANRLGLGAPSRAISWGDRICRRGHRPHCAPSWDSPMSSSSCRASTARRA